MKTDRPDPGRPDPGRRSPGIVRRAGSVPVAAEAAVRLTVASLRIRRTSSERLVALLGEPVPADIRRVPADELGEAGRADVRRAQRIGRIVTRVAGVLPWRPTCLRQSLATRAMLDRRGIEPTMHLGVADVATMDAHAWVTVHGWTVVGQVPQRFTPVASFPPPPRRAAR